MGAETMRRSGGAWLCRSRAAKSGRVYFYKELQRNFMNIEHIRETQCINGYLGDKQTRGSVAPLVLPYALTGIFLEVAHLRRSWIGIPEGWWIYYGGSISWKKPIRGVPHGHSVIFNIYHETWSAGVFH